MFSRRQHSRNRRWRQSQIGISSRARTQRHISTYADAVKQEVFFLVRTQYTLSDKCSLSLISENRRDSFIYRVPRCDRQYWAEFSNSYSQHLRYLAKAKRRTSASLNASSRQNGTCSHLRGGANMCRVGIKDARRSSQIESSKTPFPSISFRVGNGLTSEKMSFAHFPVLRYLNNLGSKPRQRVNLVELTGCATHCSLRVCPCINV